MDFKKEVIEASQEKPVLVYFSAKWCGPCRIMKPWVEDLKNTMDPELGSIVVIDVDEEPEISINNKIKGIPSFVIFSKGNAVDKKTGVLGPSILTDLLKTHSE